MVCVFKIKCEHLCLRKLEFNVCDKMRRGQGNAKACARLVIIGGSYLSKIERDRVGPKIKIYYFGFYSIMCRDISLGVKM